MWRIPSAPPGFFPLGKSLHGSEVVGVYFRRHVQFCEVYYRSSQLTSQRRVQCACNNLTIHAMYKLYLVGTVVSPAEPGPGASEPAQHRQAVGEAQ